MKLAPFINTNIETLLQGWEAHAQSIHAARRMNQSELRNDARSVLLAIAKDLEQPNGMNGKEETSKGREPTEAHTAAAIHGFARQSSGFTIVETISEFRALRASVIALWTHQIEPVLEDQLEDLVRFNEAIDEAVNGSVASYAHEKDSQMRLVETILKASPDVTYVLDANGRFLYANQAMEEFYDLPRDKIIGELADNPNFPLDAEVQEHITRVMCTGQSQRGELSHSVAGGDRRYEYYLIPVLGHENEIEATVGILHDITERKLAEEEIWHNANYDLLTGLPNRRLFFDRLGQEVEHSARTGLPLAVLYIDLDGFKDVNDRLGHQAGDQLLQRIAKRLNRCIRKADTAARLGGDEFAVILTDLQASRDINKVAEKISAALDKQIQLDDQPTQIRASIGIALCPKDATTPEDLLKRADRAMYRAKTSKHQHICFFDATSPGSTLH